MRIVKAAHLGMCFGVRDAIDLALKESDANPATVLGELVHNETVLNNLKAHGVRFARSVEDIRTSTAVITAHGASRKTIEGLENQGLNVVQATCPLVHYAHRVLAQLVSQGWHPVLIGRRDHVEVRGLTGDLEACDVVLSESDVRQMRPRSRFGVAAQTTQPIEKVRDLVECIRRTFSESEVRFVDTVCQPTKQRQAAAEALASRVDVVVVIGGANSNNTHELVNTCAARCDRVHHVQSAEDLRSTWFSAEDTIGVTAGTSTPDKTIEEVIEWLEAFERFQNALVEHMALQS